MIVVYNKAIIKSGLGTHPSTHPPLCAQTRQFVRTSVRQQHATVQQSVPEERRTRLRRSASSKIKTAIFRLFRTKRYRRTARCDAPAAHNVRIYFCRQKKKRKIDSWGYFKQPPFRFAVVFTSYTLDASSDIPLYSTANLSVR